MQHVRGREYRLARQGSLKAVEVTEKGQLLVLILRSEDNKEQPLVRVTGKGIARYPQERSTSVTARKCRACAVGSCEYTGSLFDGPGITIEEGLEGWVREEVSSSLEKYFHISQQFCAMVEPIEGHNVTNT